MFLLSGTFVIVSTCTLHAENMIMTCILQPTCMFSTRTSVNWHTCKHIPFKCFINLKEGGREGGETENKLEKDMVNLII